MLLYLAKHSCPNLANVTRELLKANDGANAAAYKKLLHVIKYVLDTKNLGLKIELMGKSNEPWGKVCFTNSNYAGDLVSRRSISGFILYLLGVLVSWQSKFQKSVSLSSSEVEYIILFEAKEVKFVIQLLRSMRLAVKYLVTVRVDNMGAIFMASNISPTFHAKHKDQFLSLLIMTATL